MPASDQVVPIARKKRENAFAVSALKDITGWQICPYPAVVTQKRAMGLSVHPRLSWAGHEVDVMRPFSVPGQGRAVEAPGICHSRPSTRNPNASVCFKRSHGKRRRLLDLGCSALSSPDDSPAEKELDLSERILSGEFTDQGSTREKLTRPLRRILASSNWGPGTWRSPKHFDRLKCMRQCMTMRHAAYTVMRIFTVSQQDWPDKSFCLIRRRHKLPLDKPFKFQYVTTI